MEVVTVKQVIKWVRETLTPMDAVKKWVTENIKIRELYVLPNEKQALLKAGRNYDDGGYIIADRIIDGSDGKKKTVFIRFRITDIVAVEADD